MPTTWDEHGNVIKAPPQKQSWDENGNPISPEKAGFGKRFLESSGFEGLVEAAKNPAKDWSDVFSRAFAPAKQAASAVAAPAKHLQDIITAHQAGDKDSVLSGVSKLVDSFIPGTGNANELSQQTIKDVQEKNVGALGGTATGLATNLALSKGAIAEGPGKATSSLAGRMYQSALKPSTTFPTSKVAGMVKTGLEEGIPVSASGAEKLSKLIDDVNTKIKAQIDTGAKAGQTVNKYAVTSRLSDTAKKFSTQVNPEADLSAIGESGNEFLRSQPKEIPLNEAQALKQGTYQQLKGRAYGELKSATVESQKALARGLKEEIATQFPEIADLNAKESQLINLDGALERAVKRIDNHQMMGIGTPIAAGAAGAISKSTPIGAAAGILKAVIDDPFLKSKLAISLSRKGIPLPMAQARVAAYAASLANASSGAAPSSAKDETAP